MAVYSVAVKFRETVGGYFNLEADDEEHAKKLVTQAIEEDGGEDVVVLAVSLIATTEEYDAAKNGLLN